MRVAFGVPLSLSGDGNKNYYELMKTCLKTMLLYNKRFKYPIYIFTDDTLSDEKRIVLSSIYDGVIFVDVDAEKYKSYGKIMKTFYSIECFKLKGYDRVISIDADCLCQNSIKPLIKYKVKGIGMPREKRRSDMFSSGVMIISKKYLNDETYEALLRTDYTGVKMFGTDMKMYNLYFKGKVEELPYRFDVVDTECPEFIDLKKVIFLHLINKPGCGRLRPFYEALWERYNEL